MEDRLHFHWIRTKQWPNDRQYSIQTVQVDTQNRTEIGGWQSVDFNRYVRPQGRVRSPYYFLKQIRIAGTNGISPALLPGERQLFLMYIIICSLNPFSWSKYSRN